MDNQTSGIVDNFSLRRTRKRSAGFSLIELMVTLGVFLVIGGATISLVNKHVPLFASQQNQAEMNFGLRNAAAQIQIDMANAGNGFYRSLNFAAQPLGVEINHTDAGSGCYDDATKIYGPTCFDGFSVISYDTTAPIAHPTGNGSNCVSTTSSELFVTPADPNVTASQLAAAYKSGDQILVVSQDGSKMTSVVLTKDGNVTGQKVSLQHNPTGANGVNAKPEKKGDTNPDPLGISFDNRGNQLGDNFCQLDWVIKVSGTSSVTYSVDTSVKENPKLIRQKPGDDCSNDKCVVAEQIVGLKLGALVQLPAGAADPGTDCQPFCYNPASYSYDPRAIRGVRFTIIGRTTPGTDPNMKKNDFDKGPYKVESISVVVNPRNLSMNR